MSQSIETNGFNIILNPILIEDNPFERSFSLSSLCPLRRLQELVD